jgi:hypothetical protein
MEKLDDATRLAQLMTVRKEKRRAVP